MKERPILFSAPMVRSLLDGTKTQTRRIAKKPVRHPDLGNLYAPGALVLEREPQHVIDRACPYGQPGDRLWVRENFYREFDRRPEDQEERIEWVESGYLAYRASDDQPYGSGGYLPWRPSIHMPRWASRITLEVTGVRVERLQDISEVDALAEGIQELIDAGVDHDGTPRDTYRVLWESINGPGAWDANPWVWVIEFRRIEA